MKHFSIARFGVLFFVFTAYSLAFAQDGINPDPRVTRFPVTTYPLMGTVNLSEAKVDFGAFVANTHTIHTPGVDAKKDDFVRWKAEANQVAEEVRSRAIGSPAEKVQSLNPPDVGSNFFAHSGDDIPNDNAIAISAGGKVVSSMNSQVRVYDQAGGSPLLSATFNTFATLAGLSTNVIKFDPKLVYDPIADRFILTFLYGDTPSSSRAILAFTQTNDPAGTWNVYTIPGNLNALGVWADFPQIGISTEELFLTCNLFQGTSSQGSGLWQIKLSDGYAGNALTSVSYFSNYFSLHPVQGGYTMYGPHFYLISHQSTQSSNAIYVHKVTGNIASNPVLNAPATMTSNQAYAIAPDADQRGSSTGLQTNDCRIQSSYFENNRIQFTQNTGFGGRPSVYYGTIFISPLGLNFSSLTATVISDDVYEMAYGSVAYAGSQAGTGENASFVSFNFCSPNDYASHGAVYLDGSGIISPIRVLKAGSGAVGFGAQWRWGDYADLCERAGVIGEAWVTGSFGNGTGGTSTWLSQIMVPAPVATEPVAVTPVPDMVVYPNPMMESVHFDFSVPRTAHYIMRIVDVEGRVIETLVERTLKAGDARLVFNLAPLAPGTYFVQVTDGVETIYTEKLIKQ